MLPTILCPTCNDKAIKFKLQNKMECWCDNDHHWIADMEGGRYGITANELHEQIIKSMLGWSKHFNMGLEDILERHEKHPLEQTINSCLTRLYLEGHNERKR